MLIHTALKNGNIPPVRGMTGHETLPLRGQREVEVGQLDFFGILCFEMQK